MEPKLIVRVSYIDDEVAARRVLEILRQGFRQSLHRPKAAGDDPQPPQCRTG